jgi:hypothetical protein
MLLILSTKICVYCGVSKLALRENRCSKHLVGFVNRKK